MINRDSWGGREIIGEMRERTQAKEAFKQAIHQGKLSALMEENSSDAFQVSIGRFARAATVEIQVEYCLELALDDGALRLTVPSYVSPRYCPRQGATSEEVASQEAILRYGSTSAHAEFVVEVSVLMSAGVAALESPTHGVEVFKLDDNGLGGKVTSDDLTKDVVILIRACDLFKAVIRREFLPARGTEALMLNLVPSFDAPSQRLDAVFVLDCSGSMNGLRIQQAKRALSIFLRSLPADCFFNIVLFGSSFKTLYDESKAYDETSLQEASAFADEAGANLGGTELCKPLSFIMQRRPRDGFQRAVFLLTDGNVSNKEEVLNVARNGGHRIFAVGIGSGVSTGLVNGVARVSQGSAAFVQDTEPVEPICISMLRNAIAPPITNVAVSWPRTSAFRSQTKVPPMIAGEMFTCFALFPGGCPELAQDAVVSVVGETPSGQFKVLVPVPQVSAVVERQDAVLHHLFARNLMRDVETTETEDGSKSQSKMDAIQMSVFHSVLCKHTAFIAIEETDGLREQHHVEILKSNYASARTMAAIQRNISQLQDELSKQLDLSKSLDCSMQRIDSLADLELRSHSLQLSASQFGRPASRRTNRSSVFVHALVSVGQEVGTLMSRSVGWILGRFGIFRTSEVQAKCDIESRPVDAEFRKAVSPSVARAAFAASASSSAQETSKMGQLEALLRLARFDGSFTHSPELQALTGIEKQGHAWANQHWGRPVSEDAFVTARVLAHLETAFSRERQSWGLVAEKARSWLHAQQSACNNGGCKTVAELIAAAATWTSPRVL
eukprot:TRINITY_DN63614_c0_g1_i1.p1 TRINITY_DN63614_c0_g1~~TRINITY_DN63614_c0_g1_i1.p1  ORF type:complete len:784 (+),score=103.83 TRINITY_DN63614_c0_g1_i1:94-2445(+)